jgi:SAM-dependent methyltransferase
VKNKILATVVILVTTWGWASIRNSFAQTAGEMHAEQQDLGSDTGHNVDGASDGAFHRRFEKADKWAKQFDDPERDAWQKPQEILDALHLEQTSTLADVGAGTGYFSVRIAKRLPKGKIFAADIEPDMVRYLGKRAQHEHLTNLVPVQASADAADLPEPVDIILIRPSLRHAGRLAIIDFKADSPGGPPAQYRVSPERVTQELNAAGYSLMETLRFLPRQYFLIFQKTGS